MHSPTWGVVPCREGFNEVFALEALNCFYEDELEAMLCGVGEKWTVEKLAETIKCDHGCALTFSEFHAMQKRLSGSTVEEFELWLQIQTLHSRCFAPLAATPADTLHCTL
jgi:E3 ubiquitin-protein ligase TRIP12